MNKPLHAPALEPEIERELLRAYIDSANDGIFVLCDEMKFHVANPLLAAWLGMDEAALTAHGQRMPITALLGVDATAQQFQQNFSRALEGHPVRFEAEIHPARGSARWVDISMNRVRLDAGELVIGVVRETTERRQLQAALQHHASHDDLTGLLNRREFQQRLHALVDALPTHAGPHALIYVDLDQFKVVNDTCGHLAGDELLRQLGTRLRALVGPEHVIARLGGDEFGLLLRDHATDDAMQLAQGLADAVAAHRFDWAGRHFEVTASIGVCSIGPDTVSAQEVMSSADAACYVAKDEGRNRVQLYFGGTSCKGKRQEMEWVSRLQKALEDNRFQIWQQRILDLKSDAPAHDGHVEMLLRLVDERGDIVAPGQFFPAAERYGLMPAIDRWVIQHLLIDGACDHVRSSTSCREARDYAINLSGASLNDDKFLDFLGDTLQRAPASARALCFEITETVAVSNFGRVREVMQHLRQYGCRFALDDFGSGMSSFSYLKNLPVDYLKIDGALVRNIVEDRADFAMVEAINRVGAVLGLKTIAEFVESAATLERLRSIGVDYAQGYVIHRPEPLALCPGWRSQSCKVG
jgi:diguanylate cyclase (GGDEF)-like protein/PAS domain S-box-containing protein